MALQQDIQINTVVKGKGFFGFEKRGLKAFTKLQIDTLSKRKLTLPITLYRL